MICHVKSQLLYFKYRSLTSFTVLLCLLSLVLAQNIKTTGISLLGVCLSQLLIFKSSSILISRGTIACNVQSSGFYQNKAKCCS